MATDIYVRLTYEEYKLLERELKDFSNLETTHESGSLDSKFYHKSIRLHIGEIIFEIHGPLVKP